jgi:methionine aminopeptidase
VRFGRHETALPLSLAQRFQLQFVVPTLGGIADLCETFGLAPKEETPGRQVVRHLGASLVKAIEMSMESGEPEAAISSHASAWCWLKPKTI